MVKHEIIIIITVAYVMILVSSLPSPLFHHFHHHHRHHHHKIKYDEPKYDEHKHENKKPEHGLDLSGSLSIQLGHGLGSFGGNINHQRPIYSEHNIKSSKPVSEHGYSQHGSALSHGSGNAYDTNFASFGGSSKNQEPIHVEHNSYSNIKIPEPMVGHSYSEHGSASNYGSGHVNGTTFASFGGSINHQKPFHGVQNNYSNTKISEPANGHSYHQHSSGSNYGMGHSDGTTFGSFGGSINHRPKPNYDDQQLNNYNSIKTTKSLSKHGDNHHSDESKYGNTHADGSKFISININKHTGGH